MKLTREGFLAFLSLGTAILAQSSKMIDSDICVYGGTSGGVVDRPVCGQHAPLLFLPLAAKIVGGAWAELEHERGFAVGDHAALLVGLHEPNGV